MTLYAYLTRFTTQELNGFIDGYCGAAHLGLPEKQESYAKKVAKQVVFYRGQSHTQLI